MTRTILRLGVPVLAAAAVPSVAPAADLHLLGLVPQAYAWGVSSDGRTVVGSDAVSSWIWTFDTWVYRIDGSYGYGNGVGGQGNITADGRIASCPTLQPLGKLNKTEATLYDLENVSFDPLGSFGFSCDIERSGAWGMSANGQYVVGLAWEVGCAARGFLWNSATDQITNLGTLYFYKPTRANDVSDDGRVIAGWNDDYTGYRQGAVWRRNASGVYVQTNIVAPGSIKMSEGSVCSGDGNFIYGIGRSSFASGAVWRYNTVTSTLDALPPSPGSGIGYPVDANFDGSKVLCFNSALGSGGSFLWTAERGYVPLAQLASEAGITIPDNWVLNLPLGMSEDGLTIVGTATRSTDYATSPFVLDLRSGSTPCPADFDGDGIVGAGDLAQLLGGWGSFNPDLDLDGDGVVGAGDLSILLGLWGTVCP